MCRQWSHLYKIEEKPANEYLADPGVQLVNKYAELKNKQKQVDAELDAEIEKLEEAIIHFAEKEKIDVVFGSGNKIKISMNERYVFPAKNSKERETLERLLKEHEKWNEITQMDTTMLGKVLQEKIWDKDLMDLVGKYVSLERSKRLFMSKIKKE
jgi:hypothetical protein